MSAPILELRGVGRTYGEGEHALTVLEGVDLDIAAGEMIAIIGPSGSGKSTLMNLLGCLDRPSVGHYRVDGREVSTLDSDALAALRRERFGFVFQRYQLLPALDALGNVEMPAIYAGMPARARRERALGLLRQLGLGERTRHRPTQLSGGQQQRTGIARALMNGGTVILADEPTGALDSQAGRELMALLEALNRQGHTVVIVTHAPEVAAHARRVVEICDGRIVAERRTRRDDAEPAAATNRAGMAPPIPPPPPAYTAGRWRDRFGEAFRMALGSMRAHRLRSFLTMLGIIIGIASVTSVVALAGGAKDSILADIGALGTNTVDIHPGEGFGDSRAAGVRSLVPADAEALAALTYVDSATPTVSTSLTLRYGNLEAQAQAQGVGAAHFRVKGVTIAAGRAFDADAVRAMEQVVVIDDNTRRRFFGEDGDAVGAVLLLGKVPCRVIGVTRPGNGRFGSGGSLNVWVPYSTAMARIQGQTHLSGITVRVRDAVPMAAAEDAIVRMLTLRHGGKDFFTSNIEDIRETIDRTTGVMSALISSIALISLLVGGIGVMNIMLVSVTERTREIGVRLAVGARRSDILQQFLIEAVVICLVGGALGVALAMLAALAFNAALGFRMQISAASVLAAFACSSAVGVAFGYLPARNAARLDPVQALSRE